MSFCGYVVLALMSVVVCSRACGVRGSTILGGPEDASPNDAKVIEVAQFAVAEFNKKSNDAYLYKIVTIVSAQKQVVSGVKYILKVEVGRTQCRQGMADALESCDFAEPPQKRLCDFDIVTVPWTEEINLVKNSCMP
ncbi:cystatin-like [Heterodontus francisci]|uniref:cystatin-like n=1 Tax=Heterodontus francisci TaxID=7792 RepID=UPI00355BDAD4